ncbi:MAG: hypothetical protein HYR64_07075 [Fimbriimonas ginsengisoli]|uniref:Segregation and condensation protein A n=1 Tax=Fimbriimonas ginsengisoli TaxID=1005039 RepID=A0A931M0U7_FIMGI|nr:hypothetical protein [Fimbriimonas ginsengisoli]
MALRRELAEPHTVGALGVVAPPLILVESPNFDGSLGQLFRCVRDGKVDLAAVSLLPICEAYFEYLMLGGAQSLDEAAAALAALAYLIERKAWGLLPSSEAEPVADDPAELPSPSTHEYRAAMEALRVWHEERSQLHFRAGAEPAETPLDLGGITPVELAAAFERVMRRCSPTPPEPARARRSLSDQMVQALGALQDGWKPLLKLLPDPFTREDAVYWFLALLELIRLGQAKVRLHAEELEFARAKR